MVFCVKCTARLFYSLKYLLFWPWKHFYFWWVEVQGYFHLIFAGWIIFHASLHLRLFYQPILHCLCSFPRVKPILKGSSFYQFIWLLLWCWRKYENVHFFIKSIQYVQLLIQKGQIMITVELVFFETANSKRFPAAPNFIGS